MKDEQRITVSIDCLCLCIWLNSAHVRGTSFFFLAKWRWPQGRTKRRLLSVFYSVSVLSHNTANLCSGTRGVETNEGLPMWKWFPHRPVRALVLISGNELWLEKLSSGRQAAMEQQQKSYCHEATVSTLRPLTCQLGSFNSLQLLIQSSEAQRPTQDREVRLLLKWLREHGKSSMETCRVVISLTAASVGKVKIQWVQFRVKCTAGISHKIQSIQELESGDDVRPTRQQRLVCATVPHCASWWTPYAPGFLWDYVSGQIPCSAETVSMCIFMVTGFFWLAFKKQAMGYIKLQPRDQRGQGRREGTGWSPHF